MLKWVARWILAGDARKKDTDPYLAFREKAVGLNSRLCRPAHAGC